MPLKWLTPFLLCGLLALPAAAQPPFKESSLPPELRPWVPWVLQGHESAFCSRVWGEAEATRCAWPTSTSIALSSEGASFEQWWSVEKAGWVELPGDAAQRPFGVRVDGAAAPTILRQDKFVIWLEAGTHRIEGQWQWSSRPETLALPAETGLIALKDTQGAVKTLMLDAQSRLWTNPQRSASGEKGAIEIEVHRRLRDGVPLLLETRLRLKVGGQTPELHLPWPALPSFVLFGIESPLPVEIDAERGMRVQLRPGTWEIVLHQRSEGPVDSLKLPALDAPWPSSELWVVEADPAWRSIEVQGPASIDPRQSTLDEAWADLPAYRIGRGESLRLIERARPSTQPTVDDAQLRRELWLDFDGSGYTLQETLKGRLRMPSRIEALPGLRLGRAHLDDQDQVVSRLSKGGALGVALRAGNLELQSESRWTGSPSSLPALGWAQNVDSLHTRLHLPPGWMLLGAMGADEVQGSWMSRWDLLDLLLVFLVALAVARMWGRGWGVLALLALVLILPEEGDAPRWIWPFVLLADLSQRVRHPQFAWWVGRALRWFVVVDLLVVSLPFAAHQARVALHPGLSNEALEGAQTQDFEGSMAGNAYGGRKEMLLPSSRPAPQAQESKSYDNAQRAQEPAFLASTGPGLPQWQGKVIELSWNGPVEASQQLRLWLIPPWASRLLTLLRLALLFALIARFLQALGSDLRRLPLAPAAAFLALLMPQITYAEPAPASEETSVSKPAADTTPGKEDPRPVWLDALRERLLEAPSCLPQCATPSELELEVEGERLVLNLVVDVAYRSTLPLPSAGLASWPDKVEVEGQAARKLAREGAQRLAIGLEKGRHRIRLSGSLGALQEAEITLPYPLASLRSSLKGWTLLPTLRSAEQSTLRLRRVQVQEGEKVENALPLKAFLRIEHHYSLGLEWRHRVKITRVGPATPLSVRLPLLPGETLLDPALSQRKDEVEVLLPADREFIEWESLVPSGAKLELHASSSKAHFEAWTLEGSGWWQVGTQPAQGLHAAEREGSLAWLPWPGQRLGVRAERPLPYTAQERTVDHVRLRSEAGQRHASIDFELRVRSSRASLYALRLPAGSDRLRLEIDGRSWALQQQGRSHALPLRPGAQNARLRWVQNDALSFFVRTPQLRLPGAVSNVEIEMAIPRSRWILLCGGPGIGPAVLFWSLLALYLVMAYGLGRFPKLGLRAYEWFLLALGLTQVDVWGALLVVAWFIAFALRPQHRLERAWLFDLRQIALLLLTLASASALAAAVQRGLLGEPDMQIRGNASSRELLRWYIDRSPGELGRAWAITLPLWVYRIAMLLWALWLAQSLLRWLRWAWEIFSSEGLWRPLRAPKVKLEPPAQS